MPSEPRTFILDSPHLRGEDIADFQRLLNRQFKRWNIDLRLIVDEDYGQDTREAAQMVCRGLGIMPRQAMRHGVTPALRIKIRHPKRRTDREKERFKSPATKRFRASLRERFRDGGTAAVARGGAQLANVRVTATAGAPHWGGSNDVMRSFVEPFMVNRGLRLGSGKRTPAENFTAGGSKTSDHLTTRTNTAARDFPTFTGEGHARALATAMGFGAWKPNDHTGFGLSSDGHSFRVQILWGAGIQHGDHVHVGIIHT